MKLRRLVITGAAAVGVGAAALIAAPAASAFTFTPQPGGGTVTLNQDEARVVGNANIGPAVDTVLPGYRGRGGDSLGQGLDRRADLVGRVPGAKLDISVSGLPGQPSFGLRAHR